MAEQLPQDASAFYNDHRLQFITSRGSRGVLISMQVETPARDVVDAFSPDGEVSEIVSRNIGELYDSVEAHQATVDGNTYNIEMGVIQGSGDRVRLHNATYSSSLVANHGNGFETARDALLDPDITQVYMGAPGIGLTSPLSAAEQKYLRRWGSLLDSDDTKDIRPLPFVKAMGRVLKDMGITVTDLHSDSAGALPSLAYGVAFGGGNILTSHQNVRPGIKDVGALSLAYGMLRTESKRSGEHAKLTPDVLGMDDGKLAFTDEHISEEFKQRELAGKTSPAMLWSNLVGLSRGPFDGDPLLADNIAFAQTNGDARILLTVGSRDPLAQHDVLSGRLQNVVRGISLHSKAPVHAVTFEGMSHSIQTHYPQYLRGVAKYLLEN